MVAPDAAVTVVSTEPGYVSRAAAKLAHALDVFPVEVAGRRALDVGASTGGFTEVLLRHGAASVCALDVGYGQMHWRVRTDERVDVVERTNFRHADLEALGAPFDVVVADLSFISLTTVASQLVEAGGDGTDWILLVKPQFEVGKDDVGSGGVVRDEQLWSQAVSTVIETMNTHDLGLYGCVVSPVAGTKGNREFTCWFRRGRPAVDVDTTVADAVASASATGRDQAP